MEDEQGYWVMPEDNDDNLAYHMPKWQKLVWNDTTKNNVRIQSLVNCSNPFTTSHKKSKIFEPMCREVFHTVNSYRPKAIPEDELTNEGKIASKFHSKMQSQSGFNDIRDRCIGNTSLSVFAAEEIAELLYANMITKDAKSEKKKEIEQLKRIFFKHQNTATLIRRGSGVPSNLNALDKEMENIEKKIKRAEEELEYAENIGIDFDKFTNMFNEESEYITNKLDDAVNVIDAMHVMAGKKDSDLNGKPIQIDQNLLDVFMRNENIVKAFELAGRLKRLAKKKLKEKCDGKSELVGLTAGNDLQRVLPSDMLLLANKQTKYLFAKRFYERSLMQYKLQSKESKGKGPIYMLIDVSGSMAGFREQYAGAMAIALMYLAIEQKREFYISHFNTNILTTYKYDKNHSIDHIIKQVMHPPSQGGTNIAKCLFSVLKNKSIAPETDVMLLTDGCDLVNHQLLTKTKETYQRRVFSIMCGGENSGLKKGSNLYVDANLNIDAAEDVFERIIS